jgi:hypothetical protein
MTTPTKLYLVYLTLAILLGLFYHTKEIFNYESLHNSKLEYPRNNKDTSDKLRSRKLSICILQKF